MRPCRARGPWNANQGKPNLKTLLLIHSCERANETVKRHWRFYENANCDIMGVGREDSHCWWPEGIASVDIGRDAKMDGDNLCRRLVDTFRFCLENLKNSPYTDFCIIEYDTLFFKPLPIHPGGLVATLAGHAIPGFLAKRFYHTPWWADIETADTIVKEGDRMIRLGLTEKGTPDFFLGLLCERTGIEPITIPFYSRNTIEWGTQMEEARQHMRDGVFGLHGIKHENQLTALLQ